VPFRCKPPLSFLTPLAHLGLLALLLYLPLRGREMSESVAGTTLDGVSSRGAARIRSSAGPLPLSADRLCAGGPSHRRAGDKIALLSRISQHSLALHRLTKARKQMLLGFSFSQLYYQFSPLRLKVSKASLFPRSSFLRNQRSDSGATAWRNQPSLSLPSIRAIEKVSLSAAEVPSLAVVAG
jgi:hypothetical protein